MRIPPLSLQLFLLVVTLTSQLAQVTGESEPPQWTQYRSETATKRLRQCSVYCPSLDVMLSFGGQTTLTPRPLRITHLELFDFADNSWDALSAESEGPPARWDCGFERVSEDPSSCSVVLYGGAESEDVDVWLGTLARVPHAVINDVMVHRMTWQQIGADVVPVSLVPNNRDHFATAQLRGNFYMFGGESQEITTLAFRDLWRLELFGVGPDQDFTHNSTGNVTARWTQVATSASEGVIQIPATVASSMVGLEDENELVVYGGVQLGINSQGSTQSYQINDMWRFSVDNDMWSEVREASPDDQSKYSREGHMMVALDSRVYLVGGIVQVSEWGPSSNLVTVFHKGIMATSPTSENPMDFCDPDGKVGLVWCALEGVDRILGRGYGACVLRNEQLVCYGGFTLFSSAFVPLNDLVVLDLALLSDSLWKPADEEFSYFEPLLATMYFFFVLVAVTVFLVILTSYRSRMSYLRYQQEVADRAPQGARQSVVNKIPLIKYHKALVGKKPEAEVNDEEEEDEKGSKDVEVMGGSANAMTREEVEEEEEEVKDVVVNVVKDEGDSSGGDGSAEEEEEECCPICLMEFEEGEDVRQLPCAHIFHPHCVDVWLLGNKSCPMCKQAVDETPTPSGFLGARQGSERSNPLVGEEFASQHGDIEAGTSSTNATDVPHLGRVAAVVQRSRQTRREVLRRMNPLRRRNATNATDRDVTSGTASRGAQEEEGIEMVAGQPAIPTHRQQS